MRFAQISRKSAFVELVFGSAPMDAKAERAPATLPSKWPLFLRELSLRRRRIKRPNRVELGRPLGIETDSLSSRFGRADLSLRGAAPCDRPVKFKEARLARASS
jgi:hypothetical protein